jgi:hypothetical protein
MVFDPRFPYKSICFCGPSSAETGLQASETGFMNAYQSNYSQRFAGQTSILNNLNNVFKSTVAKGPGQTGMSPAQLAAENTAAIDTTGAAAKNAEVAMGNATARGTSTLTSGVDSALKAGVESASAGQLAGEELGITNKNYDLGRADYNNALAGESSVAGMEDPTKFGSLAQTAQGQSFNQADKINTQNQQENQMIAGGITSLATSAMGGIGNLDTTGGSTGEQFQNFLSGM